MDQDVQYFLDVSSPPTQSCNTNHNSTRLLLEINKLISKLYENINDLEQQKLLKNNNKVGRQKLPDAKIYYKVTGHYSMSTRTDKMVNIIKQSPEIEPHLYDHLIIHKGQRYP